MPADYSTIQAGIDAAFSIQTAGLTRTSTELNVTIDHVRAGAESKKQKIESMKSFFKTVSFCTAAGVLIGWIAGIPYVLWQLLVVLDIWYLKLFITGIIFQGLTGLVFGLLFGIILGMLLFLVRRPDPPGSFMSAAAFSAGLSVVLISIAFFSLLPASVHFFSPKGFILVFMLLLAATASGYIMTRIFGTNPDGLWSSLPGSSSKMLAANLVIPAAVLLAAGAASVTGSAIDRLLTRPAPADRQSQPDIFLFVLDTLREDHLSCFGYEKETSPFIDEFASHAALIRNAVSTSCHSPPPHATMLTGLYPITHGVYMHNKFFAKSNPKLSGILNKAGYYCAGVVANSALHGLYGYEEGFDSYDSEMVQVFAPAGYWKRGGLPGRIMRMLPRGFPIIGLPAPGGSTADNSADFTTDHIITAVKNAPEDRPLFLFVNYIDPHFPYDPPEEYVDRFLPGNFPDSKRLSREEMRKILFGWRADRKPGKRSEIRPEAVEFLIAAYDGEINFLDHHLERLFSFLSEAGRLDNALVIITADHGEQFGEHDLYLHSNSLYEELVGVPLIIRWPGRILQGIYERRTSLASLTPTILEAAGAEIGDYLEGRSLLSELSAGPAGPAETIVTQWFGRQALYSGPLKCLFHPDDRVELFNLADDPGETTDLSDTNPDILSAFRQTLEKWELSNGGAKKQVTLEIGYGQGRDDIEAPGYAQ